MELLGAFLPFIIMMAIMYFLLIRPQKRQQQKKVDMLNALKSGDHVITIGGLYGVIEEVNDVNETVVLDCEGVYLTFTRQAIARVLEPSQEVVAQATVVEEEPYVLEEEYTTEDEDNSSL